MIHREHLGLLTVYSWLYLIQGYKAGVTGLLLSQPQNFGITYLHMLGRPKHLLCLNVVLKRIFILWHLTRCESCFVYLVSVIICYFFFVTLCICFIFIMLVQHFGEQLLFLKSAL